MRVVAKRPINQKAASAADDDFYKKHPEYVVNGQRMPIDFCDPAQEKLRDEWMLLYQKRGGEVEEDKFAKKIGDPVMPCPLMRGALWVVVTDKLTGALIKDAAVFISGPDFRNGFTDHDGKIVFSDLRPGSYSVNASKPRFSREAVTVSVAPYVTTNATLALQAQGLFGAVTNDVTTDPIAGATVTLVERSTSTSTTAITDASGLFAFPELDVGTYELQAAKPGFTFEELTAVLGTVVEGQRTEVDLKLHPIPVFSVAIDMDPSRQSLTTLNFPSGNWRESKIHFNVVIQSPETSFKADSAEFSVIVKGSVVYTKTFHAEYVTVGKHGWEWDGFDSNDVLDSKLLKGDDRQVKVVVVKGNISKTAIEKFDIYAWNALKDIGGVAPWADIKVDLKSQKVDITAAIDTEQGPDIGSNQLFVSDADQARLEQLTFNGIAIYWSRDITVGGKLFHVRTVAVQNDDSRVALKMSIDRTPDGSRSHNSGIIDGEFIGISAKRQHVFPPQPRQSLRPTSVSKKLPLTNGGTAY